MSCGCCLQTKKILQLLRLRQINNGVFVRVSLSRQREGQTAGRQQAAAAATQHIQQQLNHSNNSCSRSNSGSSAAAAAGTSETIGVLLPHSIASDLLHLHSIGMPSIGQVECMPLE